MDKSSLDNQEPHYHHHCHHHKKKLIVILVIILVGLVSFSLGASFSRCWRANLARPFYRRDYWMNNYNNNFSNNVVSNSVKLSGVVTDIKNNQITIVGDGTTNTISLSKNVNYQNASQLKINDSVIIYGQYLNNQLVANTIEINP